MEKQKKKQHQIKIELDDNVGQGEYVNLAIVTHSPAEFVMDYIRVLPGMTKSKVKSRIIMAPMHAKTLMMALQDNIKKFENKFGEIKIWGWTFTLCYFNFPKFIFIFIDIILQCHHKRFCVHWSHYYSRFYFRFSHTR